jgi:hypothetical protein
MTAGGAEGGTQTLSTLFIIHDGHVADCFTTPSPLFARAGRCNAVGGARKLPGLKC